MTVAGGEYDYLIRVLSGIQLGNVKPTRMLGEP